MITEASGAEARGAGAEAKEGETARSACDEASDQGGGGRGETEAGAGSEEADGEAERAWAAEAEEEREEGAEEPGGLAEGRARRRGGAWRCR